MKKYFYIISLVLLLSACEYEFEVSSPVGESRVFVESISGITGDESYIDVKRAVPVGKPKIEGYAYTLESFSITQDGEALALSRVGDGTTFSYKPQPKPGSRLELSIKTSDMEEIRAESLIPEPIKVSDLKYEEINGNLNWELIFEGEPKNCLLYIVDERHTNWVNIFASSDNSLLGLMNSELKTIGWQILLPITGDENYTEDNGVSVLAYSYVMIEKESIKDSMRFAFSTMAFSGTLEFHLFTISEQAYGYLNAQYNRNNNFMALLGLSPPNFAYSNIDGGFGVFAAATESVIEITIE